MLRNARAGRLWTGLLDPQAKNIGYVYRTLGRIDLGASAPTHAETALLKAIELERKLQGEQHDQPRAIVSS